MTSFLQSGIDRYRKMKRNRVLNQPLGFKKQYAIVGAGQHSTNNLHPCIWHLGLPVKWICTGSPETAVKAAYRWKDCRGTGNLEDILNDPAIAAVFVSTIPRLHAGIATKLLRHNKHVFVEKPVGLSLPELKDLIMEQKELLCQPGLQRRFAPITVALKKQLKSPISYNYRFLVGAYPEGNALFDIFVHPVDFVVQLFGPATMAYVTATGPNSYLLVLEHGSVKGVLELSTSHSWKTAVDSISINTAAQVITASYPHSLQSTGKPAKMGSLPLEKIFSRPVQKTVHLSDDFIPVPVASSHYRQGFYPQLEHFVRMVESGQTDERSRLQGLLPVYEILDALRNIKG